MLSRGGRYTIYLRSLLLSHLERKKRLSTASRLWEAEGQVEHL